MQPKMLFVRSHFQTSGICINNTCFLKPFFQIIDKHIIQHTRFPVFLGNFQIIIGNFGIENSFRNIQFRRFLFHRKNQGSQFGLGNGTYHILKIERNAHQTTDKKDKRTHNFEQGNTRSLHCE